MRRTAWYAHFARWVAHISGRSITFALALGVIAAWIATGPLFRFSDTWQLVINTSTTIVTFLMVFLIQHTQNRDTLAIQLKLAELIIVIRGAENRLATIEDMDEGDLERLHEEYRRRAEQTLEHLRGRQGAQSPAKG